jgi:hypothetical protein
MFCCSNCFADAEIKAIIDGNKTTGNCDFCGKKNVHVYELMKDQIIAELFDGLLDTYTPIANLPDGFPKDRADLLKNILYNNWHIFTVKPDGIYRLITSICADRYKEQPELFDNPVGILQSQDHDYLEENAILKNHCWNDFVEAIKRKNRFHSNYINMEVLYTFLRCARKSHKAGAMFYRSRVCPTEKGYSCKEMGAPPNVKVKGGRVNPEGISILYLADSKDTTLYEIRAGVYDYVTVGKFKLLKDIEVINLADIDKISPFIGIDYGFDFTQYATNIEHLKMVGQEIAKPLRNDNVLDYLPTQYISDYIKSKGYDGIEYISTMCKNGVNLAVFDESLFRCTGTTVYDVKSISYSYDQIK